MRTLVKKIFCLTLFTLVSANLYAETYYIDVRTAEEYAGDHIDNAINIEHSKIIEGINDNNINKDDTIYVYCRSGKRAEFAKQMLESSPDGNSWKSRNSGKVYTTIGMVMGLKLANQTSP